MLRWMMHGNIRNDRIRKEITCIKVEVAPIENKLRELLSLDMYDID